MATRKKKQKCEAGSQICSGELIQTYQLEGKPIRICGACRVFMRLRIKGDKLVGVGR